MFRTSRKIYPVYLIIDLILFGLCFFLPYIFKYGFILGFLKPASLPNFREYSFIFILWSVFNFGALKRQNLYATDRSLNIPREAIRIVISILYTSMLIAAVIFFAQYKFFSRQIFLEVVVLACIILTGWRIIKRLILRKLISEGFHNINILIIGANRIGRLILEEIRRYPYLGLKVLGFLDDIKEGIIDDIPVLGSLEDFATVVKQHFIDESILTISSRENGVLNLVNQAKRMRAGLKVVPEDFEESLSTLHISYLGIVPLITYKDKKHHPAEFALKRIFDFLVSLILFILFLPLFLIIALIIKLESDGPIFYIQKRMGYKGKVFNFYKFRSMVKEADVLKNGLLERNEAKGNVIFKLRNDPRVTKIGKFLRRTSLDELPQLINVLKGDMSLVGARPFPLEESQKFQPHLLERFVVRPGITGMAQIRGRSDLSFDRWIKWDIWYIKNWSFWLDLRILFLTLPTVFKGKGAY